MDNNTDLNNRKQKAVDIASTYMQVLITLSSGILAAVIAFYPTLLSIKDFNFDNLIISLVAFVVSIFGGLVGLGALVTYTNRESSTAPTSEKPVRIATTIQLFGFAVAIFFLFLALPR